MNSRRSRPLNLDDFEGGIEWDREEDEHSNLAHCLEHNVDEQVVEEVLYGEWINVEMAVRRAEFAIVGPNLAWNYMWTLLFRQSPTRGDMLRPVTGWDSRPSEIREWERVTGREWTGSGQKYPRCKEVMSMTENWREEEVRMREEAQAHAGEIIEGSGSLGTPRRMAQMTSVRLDGSLLRRLRALARERGVTLSDLLREGAELVLESQHVEETRTYIGTIQGATEQRTHSRPEDREFALG